MIGKEIRMERIMDRKTRNMVIVPMDHGVPYGPLKGIEDLSKAVDDVSKGGADAVLMHKGMVAPGHRGYGQNLGLIIHLSAGTSIALDPDCRVLATSVAEAVRLGADAVSIQVNVGAETEHKMLADMGEVARDCTEYGMPLLAMMYPKGLSAKSADAIAHVTRLGAELGADIVKTSYTGDKESFTKVVAGCPVPVVIAGGPKVESEEDLLAMVEDAMDCGARGVTFGRNVFQATDREGLTKRITKIVHRKY